MQTMMKAGKIAAVLALGGLVAGCTEEPMTGPGLYAENCAACHGADARGGAEAPDLTGLAKANKGVFPAAYVMSTIDGYNREATHGPMPIFGEDIRSEIEIWEDAKGVPTPTPVALILLADYLEGLQAR